tara:strand:+ start:42 stop:698 length:657 start_codon:yes stop_codon:yes gene_type:complete
MKPLVVIPTFNTNNVINVLIDKILEQCKIDILIIDDGSKDKIRLNNYKNVVLMRNKTNQGKGYTLKKSIKYALLNNYSHIISIDSDLQHDPKHIPDFLNKDKDTDIVFGSREFNRPMPLHRILSNKITSFIISKIVKNNIEDSQSGYRRYKLSVFKNIKLNENGFHFESELILKCVNKNTKISNIPIQTIYNNSISSINNFSDTFKFIRLIFRHCFVR